MHYRETKTYTEISRNLRFPSHTTTYPNAFKHPLKRPPMTHSQAFACPSTVHNHHSRCTALFLSMRSQSRKNRLSLILSHAGPSPHSLLLYEYICIDILYRHKLKANKIPKQEERERGGVCCAVLCCLTLRSHIPPTA